jgi:hypothetical protein
VNLFRFVFKEKLSKSDILQPAKEDIQLREDRDSAFFLLVVFFFLRVNKVCICMSAPVQYGAVLDRWVVERFSGFGFGPGTSFLYSFAVFFVVQRVFTQCTISFSKPFLKRYLLAMPLHLYQLNGIPVICSQIPSNLSCTYISFAACR